MEHRYASTMTRTTAIPLPRSVVPLLSTTGLRVKRSQAQRIRDWMNSHPDEAARERAANRSYVFFRITGLSNDGEPVGAQGVPLTPGRSIAVDRLHDYGTPFYIEANLAIENENRVSSFHRVMIAQDTGSAIVGPARADLYWGAGDAAARTAGRIHNPGRFVMLLPRELDMIAAGKHMPLPLPKPGFAAVAVRKQNSKGNADLAKSDADARTAAAYARGAISHPVDGKTPVSSSAAPSKPASKHVKQAESTVRGRSIRLRTGTVALGWGTAWRR